MGLGIEGAVEAHLPTALAAADPAATSLIVDPPAEGLSREVVDAVLANPPAALAYVSCDPPTLARDLKALSTKLRLDFVQPVDMFPQTAEIEVAAILRIR